MAQTLVPNVIHLVAHMSYSGDVWSNSIYSLDTGGGSLSGGETIITNFRDFCIGNTPNAGFLETITGYPVYSHEQGDFLVGHPPIFQNSYHTAGAHDATYNGAPIGSPLPKDVCVFAKLNTSGGRSGKLFIRNLLEESDVDSAVSGIWEFSAGSSRFTTARYATHVANTIADNFVGGSDAANHEIVVVHLLVQRAGDPRSAYTTGVSSSNAVRPVWNKARR